MEQEIARLLRPGGFDAALQEIKQQLDVAEKIAERGRDAGTIEAAVRKPAATIQAIADLYKAKQRVPQHILDSLRVQSQRLEKLRGVA